MPRKREKRPYQPRPKTKQWSVIPVGFELSQHGDLKERLVKIATARTMQAGGKGESSVSEVIRDLLIPAMAAEESRLGISNENGHPER